MVTREHEDLSRGWHGDRQSATLVQAQRRPSGRIKNAHRTASRDGSEVGCPGASLPPGQSHPKLTYTLNLSVASNYVNRGSQLGLQE